MIFTVLICFTVTAWGACAEAPGFTEGEQAALEYLGQQLMEPAAKLMETGEDVDDIYSELGGASQADSFPEKFDLRLRGVVTSVKSQAPWGTCWSFGTIAASESSLLSGMGLTTETYAETFGDGRWADWRDVIASFTANGDCAYMAYDNLPIKGYVYPLENVKRAHHLDNWVPSAGGTAAICSDCGYVLESCEAP